MARRRKSRSAKSRRNKTRRKPLPELPTLADIDRHLAGSLAVIVMMPMVLVGLLLGVAASEQFFGPGQYEALLAVIGGIAGGAIGWLVGNLLYRLRPGFWCWLLWGFAALTFWHRPPRKAWYRRRQTSAGQDLASLLQLRRQLTAEQQRPPR